MTPPRSVTRVLPVLLVLSITGAACQHAYDTESPDGDGTPGTQRVLVTVDEDAALREVADDEADDALVVDALMVEAIAISIAEPTLPEAAPIASEADRAFVRTTTLDIEIELALAASAAKNAERDDVKALAGMMTQDHTAAAAELEALADANHIPVPVDRNDRVARTVANVEQWVGRRFDRIYVETVLAEHVAAIESFRLQAENGTQPGLRSWAAQRLPTLEKHLQHTQKILAQLPSEPIAQR